MHAQAVALVLALTGVAAPASLRAQTERQDPHLRNDCRLATQVLESGHPAPRYEWALETISRCQETGAAVLARLWRGPSEHDEYLNRLFLASYKLRDARLTEAVTGAAQDPGLPRLVRLNAVRVLAGHAVPEFLVSISDLLRVDTDSVRYTFPTIDHVSVRDGAHAIDQATIRAIIVALGGLANDPDADVARAAMRTRREVCVHLRWQDCSNR